MVKKKCSEWAIYGNYIQSNGIICDPCKQTQRQSFVSLNTKSENNFTTTAIEEKGTRGRGSKSVTNKFKRIDFHRKKKIKRLICHASKIQLLFLMHENPVITLYFGLLPFFRWSQFGQFFQLNYTFFHQSGPQRQHPEMTYHDLIAWKWNFLWLWNYIICFREMQAQKPHQFPIYFLIKLIT